MKHIFSFIIAAALLLTCVYAHPGRTDGQGGHTDHSTGEYHFHHGYPAHQHPNGTCIYEFDDKTGQNSGNSGGGGYKTTQKVTTKVTTATKPALVSEPKESDFFSTLLCISFFVGLPIIWISLHIVSKRKEQEAAEQRRIEEEKERAQRYSARYDFLFEIFGKKIYQIDLTVIPDDISFTPSLLPIKGKAYDIWPYGSYTVFTTDSGKKYHHSYLCCNASNPHHLFEISSRFTPCSRCAKSLDTTKPEWYLQIIRLYEQQK